MQQNYNQSRVAEAGCAVAPPPEPAAEQVIKQIHTLRARVGDLVSRLTNAADALTGCVPQAAGSGGLAPLPDGLLPNLSHVATETHQLLERAEDELRRLTRALGC